ncbi:rRNA maturation RNase YbeY [uncultured Campylobacter sp.]|uniref:rRNA maturation RNase YbeY n=1 Tax=uncultured Campylobacter sp. TaxID=218934 RepID=UPI0026099E51|nr:rRNA maturation RNase YbeY [uncultured Campylobacter sp.]
MIICDESYPATLDEIVAIQNKFIELIFVDSAKMREINKESRNIDKTTDVLSFPLIDTPNNKIGGSIVINLELAKTMCDKFSHTLDEEIAILFLHGLLHIMGYDHEKDSGEMRELEKKLSVKFGIKNSLIFRATKTCE